MFFAVIRTAVCFVSVDLSLVNGHSQNVITDSPMPITFTSTPDYECGSAPIEYQVTYFPAITTPNLISLPISTSKIIMFDKAISTADATDY